MGVRTKVVIEVCVDSVDSALAAHEGGADRIELNANLPQGGITPSAGLIEQTRSQCSLPVHVLVRPRPGDFFYSPTELYVMEQDVQIAKQIGADGVVVGAILPNLSIDVASIRSLVEAAHPMAVTFHRAFDLVTDPLAALEDLVEMGIQRVLTSGQSVTAVKGHHVIRDLVERSAGRVQVIAGGGVSALNIRWLVEETGVREVHVGTGVSRTIPAGEGMFAAERVLVQADAVRAFRTAVETSRV